MLVAPAGTPKGIITRLYTELNDIIQSPEIHQKYESIGYLAELSPPPKELQRFITLQIDRWGSVVERAGLTHSQ